MTNSEAKREATQDVIENGCDSGFLGMLTESELQLLFDSGKLGDDDSIFSHHFNAREELRLMINQL